MEADGLDALSGRVRLRPSVVAAAPTSGIGSNLGDRLGMNPMVLPTTAPYPGSMLTFLLWILLAIVSLPLALIALVLYPLVWVLSLPFRLVGLSVRAVFELLAAIVRLPARLLTGHRRVPA